MADTAPLASLHEALAAASAARVGEALVALFDHVEPMPDKVRWVNRQLADQLPGDATLARACAAVAAAIDAEPGTFDRHGYHNRQHFCEVTLTAYALCRLDALDAEATQCVLLAALMHDAVHHGRPAPPFVHERASVERMAPVLHAAGLTQAQVARLAALVLATDPLAGTAFMAACCQDRACATPPDAPELAALAHDAGLARMARLLCEADVLPSLGLDAAHAMRLQAGLALEWQRPLTARDKLNFVDGVLRQGYIGPFFLPRVLDMRAGLAPGHAVAGG